MEILFDTPTIIMNTFFAVFSALLGVAFSKSDNNIRSNETKIIYIREKIVHKETVYKNHGKKNMGSSSNSAGENEVLVVFGISCLILIGLYVKYHAEIMNAFIILSTMIFIGTTIFGIVLYKRNSLDGLSRYWIIVTVLITFFNIISILLMTKQDLTIHNGLHDYSRILYYVVGAIFITLANLIIVSIYLYIMSLNLFINWPNRITCKVVRVLDRLFNNMKGITVIVVILVTVSLGFSSGLFHNLILNINMDVNL